MIEKEWNQFIKTGNILDYLQYKEADSSFHVENKVQNSMSGKVERDSEK